MSGFTCPCGAHVQDGVDLSGDKAVVISDMDIDEFRGEIERPGLVEEYPDELTPCKVFQCRECKRLLLERPGEGLFAFVPEGHSESMLTSARGKKFKGNLRAEWQDKDANGYVLWGSAVAGADSGYVCDIKEWGKFQELYFSVFRRLLRADSLGNAWLRRNVGTPQVEDVHHWHSHTHRLEHGLKQTITMETLEDGRRFVDITFGASASEQGNVNHYSTSLKNKSSNQIRIYSFGGYHFRHGTWELNTIHKRLYSAGRFVQWYGLQSQWIAPGETVCFPNNSGSRPIIWAYHFEDEDGNAFIAGELLR
nr:hypothetical protein [Rhodoferax sp.]